jgi:hypothetical protein
MSYKKNIIELLNKLMIINHIDNYDIYNELVSCINKLTDTNEIYIPINMLQINDQPQIEVVSNMIDEIGDKRFEQYNELVSEQIAVLSNELVSEQIAVLSNELVSEQIAVLSNELVSEQIAVLSNELVSEQIAVLSNELVSEQIAVLSNELVSEQIAVLSNELVSEQIAILSNELVSEQIAVLSNELVSEQIAVLSNDLVSEQIAVLSNDLVSEHLAVLSNELVSEQLVVLSLNNNISKLPIIEEITEESDINNIIEEEIYVPDNTLVNSPPNRSYKQMNIFINNKYNDDEIISYSNTNTESDTITTISESSDDSISYCTYKNKYNSVNNIFIQKPEDNIKIMIRETAENIMKDIIQDIVDNSLDDIIDDIMNDTKETECLIDNIDLKYENNINTSTDDVLFNKNKDENDKKIEGCFKQLCRFLCNKIKNNNI